MAARLLSSLLLSALLAGAPACVPVEEPTPVDEEGEEIPMPGPLDRWLGVTTVLPEAEELGTRPTLVITFDAYLQDDALLDYDTVYLSSGGLRAFGRVRHVVSLRALVFEPFQPLQPGLTWSLRVDDARLQSVTGAPARIGELPRFRVVDPPPPPAVAPPAVPSSTWSEVEAIFERKCFSCHRDPIWGLNPLRPDSLVGVRSGQVDRYLVRPFDPADSYLLQKVLPDFPLRRFTVQPPPWSDAEGLSRLELLTLEGWIDAGAPR